MADVAIRNMTRRSVPRLPYTEVAQAVLPAWDISLAFLSPARAKKLNEQLRNKTYTPNVLSYETGTKSGEILICPAVAQKQAPEYDMDSTTFTLYLFIHGLLHLKGAVHGGSMERSEQQLLARFAKSTYRRLTHATTPSNGDRHRIAPGKTGRRRRAR